MKREIWIHAGEKTELALVEDGRLAEYLLADQGKADAICLGKVVRVVKGMEAAFVDIGQARNGFLPLKERSQTFTGQPLREGDRVAVQVSREAHGEKGAFLTRDLHLCGEYLLLMPLNRHIGVSARITDAETRTALKALGAELADGQTGLVLRAAAAQADEATLHEELTRLRETWRQVQNSLPTAHAPSVVYAPRSPLQTLLDDYLPRGLDRVVTDGAPPQVPEGVPVDVVAGDALSGVRSQLERATRRRVWLDGGGSIVIDPCEALTAIDVNTAKWTGRRALRETILRANLEACEEIALQLRLRSLSGIILIDMIDMDTAEDRAAVRQALEAACARDRVKTVVHGYTALGLIEMTRKRSFAPLSERLAAED